MSKYSITELERLSSIKAHTLRIWEKRYDLFEPDRVGNNKRLYSDEDLRKVLCLATLNSHGFKISKIAGLSDQELNEKVEEVLTKGVAPSAFVDGLCSAMIDLDEPLFEKWLSRALIQHEFEHVVIEIFYPLLERVGLLWSVQKIRPAQEHFLSNLIRQKIISAIDVLPPAKGGEAPYVLFLPENCWHEISLLFYHYLLKKWNKPVVYLGQHLAFEDLKTVVNLYKAKYLVTSMITRAEEDEIEKVIHWVEKNQRTLLIGGAAADESWADKSCVFLFQSLAKFHEIVGPKNE